LTLVTLNINYWQTISFLTDFCTIFLKSVVIIDLSNAVVNQS